MKSLSQLAILGLLGLAGTDQLYFDWTSAPKIGPLLYRRHMSLRYWSNSKVNCSNLWACSFYYKYDYLVILALHRDRYFCYPIGLSTAGNSEDWCDCGTGKSW